MIQRKNGHSHIINIASIAEKTVGKGQNVYSLTKYEIDVFTQGLRVD
jgi:NADP-dependent 3-hydroxy acid dehydrogenase YdfG